MNNPIFKGGPNIALKIPKSKYDKTVAFYRDTLKFDVKEIAISNNPTISRSHKVTFGNNTLWLDCIDNYTRTETWLELNTEDVEEATAYLRQNGTETCDEIEKIPAGTHWITDPAGNVFILKQPD